MKQASLTEAQLEQIAEDPGTAMDLALAVPGGLTLPFLTRSQARAYRTRCYATRHRRRFANRELFPPLDPRYDATPWDALTFAIESDASGAMLKIFRPSPATLGLRLNGNVKGPLHAKDD